MTCEDLVARVSLLLFDRFPEGRADYDLTKEQVAGFRSLMNRLLTEAEMEAEADALVTSADEADQTFACAREEVDANG